jgi:hypothetical protein
MSQAKSSSYETGDGLALDGEGAKGTMKDAGTLQVGSSSHWDE